MLDVEAHSSKDGLSSPETPMILSGVGGAHVLPGIPLGRPDQILTPAWWQWRCEVAEEAGHDYVVRSGTLREEVGFCLLGGFGVKADLNVAFFDHLKDAGAFHEDVRLGADALERLLRDRLPVGGSHRSYRYPNQRATRIATAMERLDDLDLDGVSETRFRNEVSRLPGIGPKTASWIARNWLGSDAVAILDIHVLRAGRYIGLWGEDVRLPKDYDRLEARLLEFASALGVRASVLDAVIWDDMSIFGSKLVSQR